MSPKLHWRGPAGTRSAWLAALFILLGGWYVADSRYERPIALTNAASERLYRNALLNESLLRQSSALRRAQASVQKALSRYTSMTSNAASAAALVDTLASCARPVHVQITGLQPSRFPSIQNAKNEVVTSNLNGLTAMPTALEVRGRFIDIAHFVQQLSRQRVPIEVQDVELSRDDGSRASSVNGTIDMIVYSLATAKAPHAAVN